MLNAHFASQPKVLLLAVSNEQPSWPKWGGAAGVKGFMKIEVFYIPLSPQPASPSPQEAIGSAQMERPVHRSTSVETSGGTPAQQVKEVSA